MPASRFVVYFNQQTGTSNRGSLVEIVFFSVLTYFTVTNPITLDGWQRCAELLTTKIFKSEDQKCFKILLGSFLL